MWSGRTDRSTRTSAPCSTRPRPCSTGSGRGPSRGSAAAPDHIRLNFLAPSGLHFGQAPFAVFEQDALAGPVVRAATALLQALIAVNQR